MSPQHLSTQTSPCVIAVFDEWHHLLGALEDLSVNGIAPRGAVLFARDDGPDAHTLQPRGKLVSCLVTQTTELPFELPTQKMRCTTGALAHALLARSAQGARRLASALTGWVSREHARALERHIEKGRLVLWFELTRPQDTDVVCGRLIQTSPHVVGLCNIASVIGPDGRTNRLNHRLGSPAAGPR